MDLQPSLSQSGRSSTESLGNAKNNDYPSSAKSITDVGGQSLSSILNNPHSGKSGFYASDSWGGWWSSSYSVAAPEFSPIVSTKTTSEVSRSDFQQYLSSVSEQYSRFEDIRNHSSKESLDLNGIGGQGEALVACLREVPALYFKEDFALEEGATFRAACPFSNVSDNLVLQEKLSHYLDVVELHLVKEISLRSNFFFEAQVQLQDLNVKIVEGCSRIQELKKTISLLDKDLVDPARQIQELNLTRINLLALQGKLRLILYVSQALSALKLLVASADCAGALDVTDDLQNLLDGDELSGLHCFRHLRDYVAASIDAINSILSAEFMRASIHNAGYLDVIILSRVKARAFGPMNGIAEEFELDEEETSNIRDNLLPLIVGLHRTAKLPSVLRIYRDALTADMKTAIKNTVAELLPALSARSLDSDLIPGERTVDATDGGGPSLASKLRSLSSESFVQLLGVLFKIVWAHLVRAAEVKKSIEWIMCNLDDHYAVDFNSAAIALGAAASDTSHENVGLLTSVFTHSTQPNATIKATQLQGKPNDAMSPSTSKNFRADVLRENTEAVFAACDAAHGRWAKLLGVRALLHPKLRLQEFLSIFNITQEFITATEKIGGRLGYSIRGTLQSQAKAFLDFQHESRMTKIKAVLDQETWVEVDVPAEFQAIITSLFCSEVLISGKLDDSEGNLTTSSSELPTSNNSSVIADTEPHNTQQPTRKTGPEMYVEDTVVVKSSPLTESTIGVDKENTTASLPQSNNILKERAKPASQTLLYGGVGYHMVNCGLILLKMLADYIDMNNFLASLSSEIVHRTMEILKFFNTRTCQLVLGAGAMQVSGLKSITAKHLALASQVISFTHVIIPEIKRVLFLKVPETRRALLLSEMDRVAQDYKVHRDEIHTKLVQIMRERLLVHLRGLPQIVESWNRTHDAESKPSQFAASLTREVSFLQRILSKTLHEPDVQAIFRQVVVIFHSQISEAFSRLEFSTPEAKDRLQLDVKHILAQIRTLPSDGVSNSELDTPNWGLLDEFLVKRFGAENPVDDS